MSQASDTDGRVAAQDAAAGTAAVPARRREVSPEREAAKAEIVAQRKAARRARGRRGGDVSDAFEGEDDFAGPEEVMVLAPAPAAAAAPAGPLKPAPGPAAKPRARRRRFPWFGWISFLLLVAAPLGTAVHYLYAEAADQYHSTVAFSVRSEEATPTTPGASSAALAAVRGFAGALDSVILNEFIRSQQIVGTLEERLDLTTLYNRVPEDWVFSYGEKGSIESLVAYWNRMVEVEFSEITTLIEVRAFAFSPEDARTITRGILAASTELVNSLSAQAREDAIRFAKRDLEEAEARLREIRLKLREFRDRTQTADPTRDVEVQMGVILALQQSLAQALISRGELLDFARETDPRVAEVDRRIRAIEEQIAAEKTKLGSGGAENSPAVLSDQIGTFEELKTDLGFAEEAYVAAQSAFDLARIEARRQSRYLATHVEPTLSEASLFPQRFLIALVIAGGLFAVWGVLVLVVANVGDRR